MLKAIIATLLIGAVFYFAPYIEIAHWFHPKFPYQLIFFLFMYLFIYRLIELGMRNNREKLVEFYLGTIVGKLLFSLAFIGIFLYLKVDNVFLFVINFFALYLFYTCFEITGIYRKLRRD
jgi:hypothetical protein